MEWLVLIGVLGGIVYVLHRLRQREITRLQDAEMQTLAADYDVELSDDVAPRDATRADVQASGGPVATSRDAGGRMPVTWGPFTRPRVPRLMVVIERSFLRCEKSQVTSRFCPGARLTDFVRASTPAGERALAGVSISFLLCDANNLAVVGLVTVSGGSAPEGEQLGTLDAICDDIGMPLFELPMLPSYSTLEVNEVLAPLGIGPALPALWWPDHTPAAGSRAARGPYALGLQ